ncbi:hypothetical protein PAHAL_2G048300 [Panicum hallii]|uniref:Uncharacterized protein n=1 Tax=Panicum hallii TaxID=206008 RepID=A0A2S3GVY9_9POAL|nr:hypothetical protein PAHAL_2G048300 [Panicum hallii]
MQAMESRRNTKSKRRYLCCSFHLKFTNCLFGAPMSSAADTMKLQETTEKHERIICCEKFVNYPCTPTKYLLCTH